MRLIFPILIMLVALLGCSSQENRFTITNESAVELDNVVVRSGSEEHIIGRMAPGQKEIVTFSANREVNNDLFFERGGELEEVVLCYQSYGNPAVGLVSINDDGVDLECK